jgi:hypothetical protein
MIIWSALNAGCFRSAKPIKRFPDPKIRLSYESGWMEACVSLRKRKILLVEEINILNSRP